MSGPSSTGATLEAALAYAGRNWSVIPLWAGKKTPATPNGHLDATLDAGQIRNWFRDKGYNLGIATGPSELVVIDTDGSVGQEALRELCAGRHWPDTYTVKSRTTEGRHYYFRAPAGRLIRCSAGRLAEGVDVRGQGGYVVAPPSRVEADHKGPAGEYLILLDLPVADLPEWLVTLLTQPACTTKRRGGLQQGIGQYQKPETPREVAILRDRLGYISADCNYEMYRNVVWAILSTGWHCAEQLALTWSLTAPHRFDQRTFDTLVLSYDPGHPGSVSYGTLVYLSRQGGRRE